MLRRLEWKHTENTIICPICYEGKKYGHAADYELVKVLTDLGARDIKVQEPRYILVTDKNNNTAYYEYIE